MSAESPERSPAELSAGDFARRPETLLKRPAGPVQNRQHRGDECLPVPVGHHGALGCGESCGKIG